MADIVTLTCAKCGEKGECPSDTIIEGKPLMEWWADQERICVACTHHDPRYKEKIEELKAELARTAYPQNRSFK